MSYAKSSEHSIGVNVIGNPSLYTTFEWMRSNADSLLVAVQEYLNDAERGIDTFTPFVTPGLGNESFSQTYSGYNFNTSLPDALPVKDAPEFNDAIGQINFDSVSDPGDYNGFTYAPSFPPAPNLADIQDPGDWDGTVDVTVPTDLQLDDIIDPDIRPIAIINIPLLEIDDFTGISPDFTKVRDLNSTFEFNEIDYTSDVLTQTDSLIQQMIAGGVGIPESIWNRIWARAGVQVDDAAKQLIEQINTDWAARGFSLPQGAQVAQVAEARQETFNKKAELARDNAIQYSQEEIKNLQFAVQQGIAFETLRGGWHEQEMQRALEVSKYIIESEINLFNAELSFINAQLQQYQIEAQVYKTLIDGEVAKLEKYRLDIASQELTLKANDNQISLYGVRIQALNLTIEDFNARVQAAGVESDVMKNKVQIYSEEIKAFSVRIQAESEKVNLYKTTVDAEVSKMSAYDIAVKVYSEEVKAYSAKIGASSAKANAEISIEQLKLATYDSAIKGYAAEVGARADAYKAEISGFSAYIDSQEAAAKDLQYKTQVKVEADKNKIAFDSEKAKLQIADSQSATRAAEASSKIVIDTNKSIAEINAGLAGSIYSAMNVGSTESIRSSGAVNTSIRYNGSDA